MNLDTKNGRTIDNALHSDDPSMPLELCKLIGSYLPRVDVKRFRLVCLQWNALALKDFRAALTYELRELIIEPCIGDEKHVMLKAKIGSDENEHIFKSLLSHLTNLFNRCHFTSDNDDKTICQLKVYGAIGDQILLCFAQSNLAPIQLKVHWRGNLQNVSTAITRFHANKTGANMRHELCLTANAYNGPVSTVNNRVLAPNLTYLFIDGQHHITWNDLEEWLHYDSPHYRRISLIGECLIGEENDEQHSMLDRIISLVMTWKRMAIETKPGKQNQHWHSNCVQFYFWGVSDFPLAMLHTELLMRWALFGMTEPYKFISEDDKITIHANIGKLFLGVFLRCRS